MLYDRITYVTVFLSASHRTNWGLAKPQLKPGHVVLAFLISRNKPRLAVSDYLPETVLTYRSSRFGRECTDGTLRHTVPPLGCGGQEKFTVLRLDYPVRYAMFVDG